MAATKIVDLAKKVRELTANYESEKTRNKQLAKICQDYEGKLKELKNQNQNHFNNYDGKHLDDYDDEMGEKKVDLAKENKELKEKYNQTSHKLMEFKSQCEILKQDLKKTQKVFNLIWCYFSDSI